MFMWKEFTKRGNYLQIRYKKITWKIKILDSIILSFKFLPSKEVLYLDGTFLGRLLLMPFKYLDNLFNFRQACLLAKRESYC